MQILEASMMGLRSARLQFRSHDSSATVTLFPIVHVGEERFYAEVYADALGHDVLMFEGQKAKVGRNFTRSYRWIDLKKLGLVLQPKLPEGDSVGCRLVWADLEPDEFMREWRKVPWYWRAVFAVIAPLLGLHRRFFGSRERLAKRMSLDDLRSSEETMRWTPNIELFERGILEARDERLIERLSAELDRDGTPEMAVAIVYGARHMRAVIRELTRRGFRCAEARWMTIFKT